MITRKPLREPRNVAQSTGSPQEAEHASAGDAVPLHFKGEDAADDESSAQKQGALQHFECGLFVQLDHGQAAEAQHDESTGKDLNAHASETACQKSMRQWGFSRCGGVSAV